MVKWKQQRNGKWTCKAGVIRWSYQSTCAGYWFYPTGIGAPSHGPYKNVPEAMDAINQILEPSPVVGTKAVASEEVAGG